MVTKILIIDPDPNARDTTSRLLSLFGHAVTIASSGTKGMESFYADAPDIVLIELIMPDKCGFESMREMKKTRPATRVIIMSRRCRVMERDYLSMARKLGADGILPKPFNASQLRDAVQAFLPGQPGEENSA
jgi:DNA-binding response OmpR family regulator